MSVCWCVRACGGGGGVGGGAVGVGILTNSVLLIFLFSGLPAVQTKTEQLPSNGRRRVSKSDISFSRNIYTRKNRSKYQRR